MMPCDSPNSDEIVPKVSPVDIIKGGVHSFFTGRAESTGNRVDTQYFCKKLDHKHHKKRRRCSDQIWHRNKRTSSNEIKWREKPKTQGAQSSDQNVIFADAARKDHPNQVGGKHRLTVCPTSKPAQPEQKQQQIFCFEFRRTASVQTEKLRGNPRQENQGSQHTLQRRSKFLS